MKVTCALVGCTFLIGSFIAPEAALAQGQSQFHRPDGKGDRSRNVLPPAAQQGAGTTGNGIDYNGGPVMLGTTKMYYIWYGNWDSASVSILTNFANNIGGSPYFNINTSYFDSTNTNVTNSVTFGGSTTDNYSRTNSVNDGDIATIVSSALTSGRLPTDSHGVYFVLTSADVNETTGFCTQYCGWHTYGILNNTNIKYAFIGNPETRCPYNCTAQGTGPNGTIGADGMASVIAHELEESVSDPNLNAWYNNVTGEENADQCAWTFGTVYAASNGTSANVKLGGMDYLIQQNWVNASGGYCALSYSGSPDYSLSVSPNSQSALAGTSTGAYVVTVNPTNGFSSQVTLGTTGLPAGVAPAFILNPTTGSSNLTLSVAASVAAGSYPFTITGSGNSLNRTVGATLVVTVPNFTLSVAPTSQSVSQGGTTGNYVVTINPTNGFSGNVTFSATGLPAGATPTFTPASATSSNLKVSVATSTPTGSKSFTITGTSGSLTHTVNATLAVTSPSFTLSVSPSSQTVLQGGTTGLYGITIGWGSGSPGSVSLSATGLPAGATVSGLPLSATASASFSVITAGTVSPGSYPFTITGVDGSTTKTAAATLVVNAAGGFTLTVSPSSVTVGRPGSGTYTVTVVPSGGFNSNVTLSVSGLPNRTTGAFTPNPVVAGSGTSTLKVTTAKQTQSGTSTITITGTSGGVTSTITTKLIAN